MSAFLSPSKSNLVGAVGGLTTVTVNIFWTVAPQLSVTVTVIVYGPPTGPLFVIVTRPVAGSTEMIPLKPPGPDAMTDATDTLSAGGAFGVEKSLQPTTIVEFG